MSDDKLPGWRRRTEWPPSLLVVSFLAAYAIPIRHPVCRPRPGGR
jgi:hypothetical protein